MKRIMKRIFVGSLIALICLSVYVFWDNIRVKIVSENIVIEQLPEALEGFTILQISDLHEQEFGKDQKRLIKKINNIDYDVLVITGDVLDNPESTNYEPFYVLLEGLVNKENILFVSGNADPPSYQLEPMFGKSEFISGIEDRGGRFLESYETINIADEAIHFVNLEMAIIKKPDQIGKINGTFHPIYADEVAYQSYQRKLWEEMTKRNVMTLNEPVIALNHYPVVDERIEYIKKDPATNWINFDLIIAGHYHGGQIRIPLLGALFVPEAWYEPHSFFPPQDRVKGLWEYNQTKQYVSAGLGTSDALPLFNFRLFNPPEINVLTLKSK